MTLEQAKLELDVTTLRPDDASEEAIMLARRNPKLGAWVAARAHLDERIAFAMANSLIPSGTSPFMRRDSSGARNLISKLIARVQRKT